MEIYSKYSFVFFTNLYIKINALFYKNGNFNRKLKEFVSVNSVRSHFLHYEYSKTDEN